MPPFFSFSTTFLTAWMAIFSDFAPVHTILPELKMSVAVLGDLSLKTRPGNWSGWYSTSGKIWVIRLRFTVWLTVAEATTFSMLTIGFVCGIYIRLYKGVIYIPACNLVTVNFTSWTYSPITLTSTRF